MIVSLSSQISVMGGEQAASVLATVHAHTTCIGIDDVVSHHHHHHHHCHQLKRDNLLRKGSDWGEGEEEAFKAPIRSKYEEEGSCYYASARLWDDGIIQPEDTRHVLGLALRACTENAGVERGGGYGIFRM